MYCGYYCAHHIENWITDFKPVWRMSLKELHNKWNEEMQDMHDARWVVYNVQRNMAKVINREVIDDAGDFYAGPVVRSYPA